VYGAKNNVWMNSGDISAGTGQLFDVVAGSIVLPVAWPYYDGSTRGGVIANFGQDSSFAGNETAQGNQDGNGVGDFYFAPPTGFLALCTDNLPSPEVALPGDYFNTALYTGNGATGQSIVVGDFTPDFCWIKSRSQASSNALYDTLRGATKELISNATNAEQTFSDSFTAFTSDGFTLGADTVGAHVNQNTETYVAWNWKAGGAPTADNAEAAGATPTAGSVKIDGSNLGSALAGTIAAKRISANTTSGFSIVQYVGTGSGATIAHGLNQTPDMIISKSMDAAYNWRVGGEALGLTSANYSMRLDTTAAEQDLSGVFGAYPSASVWTIGTDAGVNVSTENYIAYCFASIEGYSKVGNYTANGVVDGPFIYTGFRPAFMMFKKSSATDPWEILDSKRPAYNQASKGLWPNSGDTEYSNRGGDFVSNGFKARTAQGTTNESTNTYIYLAFAESPFKTSNAR